MVSTRHLRFENRTTAGRKPGEAPREEDIDADLVLAIPRGGLSLGRTVADGLDVPLDIAVAQKIGAPNHPEFAIGTAAPDGSVWLDEGVVERRTSIGTTSTGPARPKQGPPGRKPSATETVTRCQS